MKTLYIISKGLNKLPQEEIIRLEKENKHPRVTLVEDALSADLLDERYLYQKTPRWRHWFYKLIPVEFAQIIEALFLHQNYDVVFSQSEKVGLPLALLRKYLNLQTPQVLIISRITSANPKKAKQKKWFLAQAKDAIDRILIWSSVQRNIAIEQLGVEPSKIKLLKRGFDQQFWNPQEVEQKETDMICSAGMEMRDYPTLVKAMSDLDIPCHIATGAARGEVFDTVNALYEMDNLPENVTVGFKKQLELRKLYARCRFVVVPLRPTDSDNGLTTILEAMGMAKPVICSQVEGQVDVIQDGITGIFVPPGDPEAMREAIIELWNNPERAAEMGQTARRYVEENHNMEQFADAIKNEVDDVVSDYKTAKSKKIGKSRI